MRLRVVDEMSIGQVRQPRRVWVLRAVRPTVPVQQRHEWLCVYGALEVCNARAEFAIYRYEPALRSGLRRTRSRCHERGDLRRRTGFHHRDGHAALPANVRVITLPA